MASQSDDAVFTFSTEAVCVGRDRAATSLVARLFFTEPKPARLIQATLSSIYGLVRSLTVTELGFNLHQLFFTSKEAMQEGLPPICFRCGRMGHNHGRCPDLLTPLDYELRGPWISLPTGSYRRVNPFTLQPDGPAQRPRDGFDMPRPSQLLEESLPVSRPVVARHSGALLPLPESSKRSARVIPRSQAPIGQASGSRMESLADSRRLVHSIRPRPDKRPMGEDARQYRPPPARSPASLGSVGSSTAAVPPGFGDDEAISLAIGLFLLLQTDHLVLCVKSIVMRRLYCVGLLVADVGNVGASPGPLPSIPLGPQLNPQASHPGWPFFWVFWPMLLHY
ncbi:hypothetical protein LINGRAHAP2_LOCUS7194 [Linum grandiflorum]